MVGRSEKYQKLKTLLDRVTSGNCSDDDKKQLQDYIRSSYHDHDLDELMMQHWNELSSQNFAADNVSMQKIKRQIAATLLFNESPKKLFSRKNLFATYLLRAAAILFIPLLMLSAYLFYLLNGKQSGYDVMQQVVAVPGTRVQFELPDRTLVWLNSGSKLEYSSALNSQNDRIVKLSGQAYFDVAHDEKHPFRVETGDLTVKVLGTSFDVSCYESDALVTTTLEEGSVVLLNKKNKEVARLAPGEQALLDRASLHLLVQDVDTKLSVSWKDGRLIFRDATLNEITKKLERWFNCSIHLDSASAVSAMKYKATIQDETLGEVLKMLEISASVKTNIQNREVYISKK